MPRPRNNRAINATKQKTRAKFEANRAQILNILINASTGVSKEAIASRLGVSSTCAARHLKLLEHEGLLEWETDGLNRSCKMWRMKEVAGE